MSCSCKSPSSFNSADQLQPLEMWTTQSSRLRGGTATSRPPFRTYGWREGSYACILSLVHKPTISVSAHWTGSADWICVNTAFSMIAYPRRGHLLDSTSRESSIIGVLWELTLQSSVSIIPLPILLPLRWEGVTASAQIFTQTLRSSPVLHLSAATVVMHTYTNAPHVWIWAVQWSLVTCDKQAPRTLAISELVIKGSHGPNK